MVNKLRKEGEKNTFSKKIRNDVLTYFRIKELPALNILVSQCQYLSFSSTLF